MAKKAAARRKPQTSTVLSRLQGNLKNLQRDTEALLSRARTQARQIISHDQKRALDRLVGQARRIRSDAEKRVRRATRQVEPRIERLFSALEKQAQQRFESLVVRLVWRMGLVTQKEMRGLSQRISQLEHRVQSGRPARRQKSAARKRPAPAPSQSVAPSSE
jgi:F0F1-type ATP synthase membrane subunit b/b'